MPPSALQCGGRLVLLGCVVIAALGSLASAFQTTPRPLLPSTTPLVRSSIIHRATALPSSSTATRFRPSKPLPRSRSPPASPASGYSKQHPDSSALAVLARTGAVVGSALLTWGVTSQEGSAIKALWASGMALVLSMTFPGYIGKAGMCGAVAGMTSCKVFPTFEWALAGALTTALAVEQLLVRGVAYGFGGRVSTTAFVGVNLSLFLSVLLLGHSWPQIVGVYGPLGPALSMSVVLVHVVVAGLTMALRQFSTRFNDAARGAALSGFLSSAMCLLLMPEGAFATDVLGAASLGGAFVGMSTPTTLLPSKSNPWPGLAGGLGAVQLSAAVGLGAGLVHVLAWPLFGGWGGRSGTCAFIAGVATKMLLSIAAATAKKQQPQPALVVLRAPA